MKDNDKKYIELDDVLCDFYISVKEAFETGLLDDIRTFKLTTTKGKVVFVSEGKEDTYDKLKFFGFTIITKTLGYAYIDEFREEMYKTIVTYNRKKKQKKGKAPKKSKDNNKYYNTRELKNNRWR